MSAPGTHLALDRDRAKELFSCRDPDLLVQLRQRLLTELSGDARCDTDDWPVLHRLLGDGSMTPDGGEYPFNQCFLGSRPMDAGADWIVRVIRPDSVAHIADALANFAADSVSSRLELLPSEYNGPRDGDAVAAAQQAIASLAKFFESAAAARSAVVFTCETP